MINVCQTRLLARPLGKHLPLHNSPACTLALKMRWRCSSGLAPAGAESAAVRKRKEDDKTICVQEERRQQHQNGSVKMWHFRELFGCVRVCMCVCVCACACLRAWMGACVGSVDRVREWSQRGRFVVERGEAGKRRGSGVRRAYPLFLCHPFSPPRHTLLPPVHPPSPVFSQHALAREFVFFLLCVCLSACVNGRSSGT